MSKRTSPYQGLAPFEEEDAPYFFGRDSETRLIIADLHAAPLTLLYGASGVGKSSVLRAGVLPALRKRKDVVVAVFAAWKDDPLPLLRQRIAQAAHVPPSTAARKPLCDFLRAVAKKSRRRVMIILDQFEEYSLYHPEDDGFAREFPPATTIDDFSVSFLISLREEAVARLDRFEGRIPTLFDNYRRIDHLTDSAARDAIVKPLDRYNEDHRRGPKMSIEPELVDAVLGQVRSGQIAQGTGGTGVALTPHSTRLAPVESPYLQLVMSRLWQYEQFRDSRVLTLDSLSRLGNAVAIVDGHLQEVMKRLSEDERGIASRVFDRLVTPSGTKIAFSVHDLSVLAAVDPGPLHRVLESLASGSDRILRPIPPADPGGSPRYEIFHDRLAPAILRWCTDYMKQQEVTKEREKELQRRQLSAKVPIEAKMRPRLPSSTGNQPPYDLLGNLFTNRNLVVVVGAGASASSRPASAGAWNPRSEFPPTGYELMQQLGAEADFPADKLPYATLAEVASYFELEFGRSALESRLLQIFGKPYPPSAMYRLLAEIARRTPQLIFTTTIDNQLEMAMRERDARFDTLVPVVDRPYTPPLLLIPTHGQRGRIQSKQYLLRRELTCVYKMFGSIDPLLETGVAITEEDEIDLAAEMSRQGSLPPPALRNELSKRHILFIGMSLGSWPQRLFIRTILGISTPLTTTRHAFAIVRGPSELDRRRWHQSKVDIFDIDINVFALRLAMSMGLIP